MLKLLCSCPCLIDAFVKLHAMDEKISNDFLIGMSKWITHVIKAYLIHELYTINVVEAFITLNWKSLQ